MKTNIKALNFSLMPAERQFIENRVRLALESGSSHIKSVDIWLTESLGSGGFLKQCLVWVELDGNVLVVSESANSSLHYAVHRSIDEAGGKVSRSILRRARIRGQQSLRRAILASAPAAASGRARDGYSSARNAA